MNTNENLKATWLAIFSRKGAAGANTRPWDSCDNAQRTAVFSDLILIKDELPVLLSCASARKCLLLTTHRLIQAGRSIPIEQISGVEPFEFARRPKSQISELQITTKDGEILRVEADPGAPCLGLWSVLLNISSKNARNAKS
jgi:hypothetical protein